MHGQTSIHIISLGCPQDRIALLCRIMTQNTVHFVYTSYRKCTYKLASHIQHFQRVACTQSFSLYTSAPLFLRSLGAFPEALHAVHASLCHSHVTKRSRHVYHAKPHTRYLSCSLVVHALSDIISHSSHPHGTRNNIYLNFKPQTQIHEISLQRPWMEMKCQAVFIC